MYRYSNHTYYIHCNNLDLIENALTSIFEQESCHRIALPNLSVDIEELRCRPWLLYKELWVIGLFVGSLEWTIIKILPNELLCCRARGANRPRLSELAMHIGSDAFYIGTNEVEDILMETDAKGSIFISGSVDAPEEDKFFEEPINFVPRIPSIEQTKLMHSEEPQRFFLLNVPEEMHKAEAKLKQQQSQKFQVWQEQFLDDYAKQHFPLMALDELEQWKVRFRKNRDQLFNEKGGKKLFRAWSYAYAWQDFREMPIGSQIFEIAIGRLLGGTPNYWHLGTEPLVYRAYTQQQQLEADGARLLYFRPARSAQA
ncbi:hypothetical protein BV372_06935 [Nostoc sp. T09]|uniref:hypothetical protein n=1 Tax=Nostoc sp. T09 TaxID=1932621 RepID=UPI000A3B47AC|nr:hypothetical protein [Nostoc sp. T09]OUL36557.1 hypothetical protein BV372_06935 [Nostoc sp. T09]